MVNSDMEEIELPRFPDRRTLSEAITLIELLIASGGNIYRLVKATRSGWRQFNRVVTRAKSEGILSIEPDPTNDRAYLIGASSEIGYTRWVARMVLDGLSNIWDIAKSDVDGHVRVRDLPIVLASMLYEYARMIVPELEKRGVAEIEEALLPELVRVVTSSGVEKVLLRYASEVKQQQRGRTQGLERWSKKTNRSREQER